MKKIALFVALVIGAVAIGQIPITGLPPATLPLSGTEQVPMVQNGKTVQAPANTVGTPLTSYTQITSLWGAPCNTSTLFLSGNGTCSNPSTPPGGSDTYIQYNQGGVFGGNGNFYLTYGASPQVLHYVGNELHTGVSSFTGPTGQLAMTINASASNQALWVDGTAGVTSNFAELITSPNTTGQSWGLDIHAGTNASDKALRVANAANGTVFSQINGDGSGYLGINNSANMAWNSGATYTFTPASGNTAVDIEANTGGGLTVDGWAGSASVFVRPGFASGNTGSDRIGVDIVMPATGTPANDQGLVLLNSGSHYSIDLRGDGSGAIGGNAIVGSGGLYWNTASAFTIAAPTAGGTALSVNAAAGNAGEVVTGVTGASALQINGPASGGTVGLAINTGGTSADELITVGTNGGNQFLNIFGDGHGQLGPVTGTHDLIWNSSGNFTFNTPASGNTVAINALAQNTGLVVTGGTNSSGVHYVEQVQSGSGAGWSYGLQVLAGTNGGDNALYVGNAANTAQYMVITGQGSGQIGPNSTNTLGWNTLGNFTIAAPSSAGNALTVNTVSGQYGLLVNGVSAASGSDLGLSINAGATSADIALNVSNLSGVTHFLQTFGDGGTVAGSATGGDKGAGTINAQGLYVNGTAVAAGIPAPITCTTACSGASLVVGQQLIINKTSSTSRASTTTQTIDTDLNVTAMPNSSYATVFISLYFGAGANAGGYRAVLNNGGACNTGFPGSGYWSFNNNTPAVSRGDAANAIAFTSSSASEWAQFTGTLQGNSGISVCWAQNTSSGTSTTLNGNGLVGTFIVVTRVL